MEFKRKDILDIEDLSCEEINFILDTAESMKEISTRDIKKVPALRGKTIVHFFHEPSTRTRTSFEIAAKRLSADTVSVSASGSSMVKGESLIDTAKNLEAMNPDVIVIRHQSSGSPHLIAQRIHPCVINAGDGAHSHPTQALLDLMTVREKKRTLEGLEIVIIGDIAHSRVARSNILAFNKMGANVTVSGPPTMIPLAIQTMPVRVTYNMKDALLNADIVMALRIQKERISDFLYPSDREYARFFCLDSKALSYAKPDVMIMHPGPINRGVEISPEIADSPRSVILSQVENGVAIRMALLYLLIGGSYRASDH
ncbi:MAG: aspartate carbamoyltransferase catalytic subunit [Pseudomonadota bacterium]